jgi:hypothetical protein
MFTWCTIPVPVASTLKSSKYPTVELVAPTVAFVLDFHIAFFEGSFLEQKVGDHGVVDHELGWSKA